MEQNGIVVGIGEILWDFLPEGKKLGGAPANFAYHISQLGLQSCVISAVGKDNLGNEICEIFTSKKLEHEIATVPFPTGIVDVKLTNDGIPQYDIKQNVAWDHISYSSSLETLAEKTTAICFGSLAQRSHESRDTIRRYIKTMHATAANPLIVFDINLRQNYYCIDTITESLRICNILKINDEELTIVANIFNFKKCSQPEICRQLISMFGLNCIILTCGINGSYVFTPQSESFLPTPKVNVIDTVGAGDSFTAAFISEILKGHHIEDAHRLAVKLSAFVCSRPGAMPDMTDFKP